MRESGVVTEPEQEEPSEERQAEQRSAPLLLRALPLVLALIAIGAAIKILQGDSASASSLPLPGAISSPYRFTAGSPAPEFTLQSLDGKAVSLKDFRGRVVLLNFWATWCPPCRSEMPDMENLYKERKDQGFAVVAVNIQEAKAPVEKFVKEFGLTFPILLDVTGEVSQQYGVQSLPTSFFIDKEGRIASFNMGAMNRSVILKKLDLVPE